MVKTALYVRLEAKPGRESDVERFLQSGLALVNDEPATTAWFALKMGASSFGIFDAFPDEAGRDAHLAGRVAEALMSESKRAVGRATVDSEGGRLSGQTPWLASFFGGVWFRPVPSRAPPN